MALKQPKSALNLFVPFPLSGPATPQVDRLQAFANFGDPAMIAASTAAYLDTSMKMMAWAFGMLPDYQAAMQLVFQRSLDRLQAIEPQEPLTTLMQSVLPPIQADNDDEW